MARRCRRRKVRGRIVCSSRGRRRSYRSKPAGMARRGSRCTGGYKYVKMRGTSRRVRRCRRYSRR